MRSEHSFEQPTSLLFRYINRKESNQHRRSLQAHCPAYQNNIIDNLRRLRAWEGCGRARAVSPPGHRQRPAARHTAPLVRPRCSLLSCQQPPSPSASLRALSPAAATFPHSCVHDACALHSGRPVGGAAAMARGGGARGCPAAIGSSHGPPGEPQPRRRRWRRLQGAGVRPELVDTENLVLPQNAHHPSTPGPPACVRARTALCVNSWSADLRCGCSTTHACRFPCGWRRAGGGGGGGGRGARGAPWRLESGPEAHGGARRGPARPARAAHVLRRRHHSHLTPSKKNRKNGDDAPASCHLQHRPSISPHPSSSSSPSSSFLFSLFSFFLFPLLCSPAQSWRTR